MEKKKKITWQSQRDGFLEGLIYMQGRMNGTIKSLKTPWIKFNDAGIDGIEWNSVVVIGGRPGNGKTLIKDQIIRESFPLNPGEDHRVLEFQFEMPSRASAIREFSSVMNKSYKYLCSAEKSNGQPVLIKKEELEACHQYAKTRVKYPIDVVQTPCTVPEMSDIIDAYMLEHSILEEKDGKETRVYKKTVITLDHTYLVKQAPYEKDKMETLYALGELLTEKKRKYPVLFIVLSQLNRNIDTTERCEEGRYGNYVLESDFFGADAMLQHADILVGITIPSKRKIRIYGPDLYIIDDDSIMVMHFIKVRNGNPRLSFFKASLETMKIVEIPTPQVAERRIKTR